MKEWVIENSILSIQNDNKIIIPKAAAIYALFTDSIENSKCDLAPSLVSSFDQLGLSYSKISRPVQVVINYDETITIQPIITIEGKKVVWKFPGYGGSDHYVDNGRWYYIDETINVVSQKLKEIGVENPLSVPFSQYLSFVTGIDEYVKLEDYVPSQMKEDSFVDAKPRNYDLKTTLYRYQETGVKWLQRITDEGCGCVLGDEMGLGKTLQAIALIASNVAKEMRPTLVVAPVSLLENWRREVERFAPQLSVYTHQGPYRTGKAKIFNDYDLVLVSYGTLRIDIVMFQEINWNLVLLDEAQRIKNPETQISKSIKTIERRAGVAVTGTPFENHMLDLWSIMDFSYPGCLGTKASFEWNYSDDISSARKIEPVISALMLRRRVSEVANDLPEKIEISQPLVMQSEEALQYEGIRKSIAEQYDPKAITLATITNLRQFCAHPFLVDELTSANPDRYSTKYERLIELLEEIIENNEKAIVFTSFTKMMQIICEDVSSRFGIKTNMIFGGVQPSDRQKIVDAFNSSQQSEVLVINPKAGGVGLNITAANHVIHYNLEWNPAVEDQATARAYRRGQDKTVFVYRLYYKDTVEEVVNEKIQNKRLLSESAVVGSTGEEDTRKLLISALEKTPVLFGE